MGGSSSQAPTQTSQATADPWSGVQPALSTLYSNTLGQFTNDVGYHPYGGNLQAPLNSALNTGLPRNTISALPISTAHPVLMTRVRSATAC